VVGLAACGNSRTAIIVAEDAVVDSSADSTLDGGADSAPDSAIDAPSVPQAPHFGYVVSKAFIPGNLTQARDYGLDLGAPRSGTPDGFVDNRLGEVLGTLGGMGFNIQGLVDTQVNQGSIILLVDFQTNDFMNANAVNLGVKFGANPIPAACNGAADTTCGHHLTGTASFSIAADSPMDAPLTGTIVDGTFNGGPGKLSLQLTLGTTQPTTFSLRNARAKATAISDTGMTANIGGALSVTDVNAQVIPAIQVQVAGVLDRDCGSGTRAPPGCGCSTGSTSETLLNLFDGDLVGTVRDCQISVEEIAANAVMRSLLAPDICSTTTCTAPDALSFGIKVQTVKATFPM